MSAEPKPVGLVEVPADTSQEIKAAAAELANPWPMRVLAVLAALIPIITAVACIVFWVQAESRAVIDEHSKRPHVDAVHRRDFDARLAELKENAKEAKADRKELGKSLDAIGRWQYGRDEWKRAKAAK